MTVRSLLLLSMFVATVAVIGGAYMAIPNGPVPTVTFGQAHGD